MSRSTGYFLALVAALALWGTSVPVSAATFAEGGEQLYCHGGGTIKVEVTYKDSLHEVDTTFTPLTTPATAAMAPGSCSFENHGFDHAQTTQSVPIFICQKDITGTHTIFTGGHGTANGGPNAPMPDAMIVEQAFGAPYVPEITDSSKWFAFGVSTDGNCLRTEGARIVSGPPIAEKPLPKPVK